MIPNRARRLVTQVPDRGAHPRLTCTDTAAIEPGLKRNLRGRYWHDAISKAIDLLSSETRGGGIAGVMQAAASSAERLEQPIGEAAIGQDPGQICVLQRLVVPGRTMTAYESVARTGPSREPSTSST